MEKYPQRNRDILKSVLVRKAILDMAGPQIIARKILKTSKKIRLMVLQTYADFNSKIIVDTKRVTRTNQKQYIEYIKWNAERVRDLAIYQIEKSREKSDDKDKLFYMIESPVRSFKFMMDSTYLGKYSEALKFTRQVQQIILDSIRNNIIIDDSIIYQQSVSELETIQIQFILPDRVLSRTFTDFFKSLYEANQSMKMRNPHIFADQFKISGYEWQAQKDLFQYCGGFKQLEVQHSNFSDITSNDLLRTYNLQTLDLMNCISVDQKSLSMLLQTNCATIRNLHLDLSSYTCQQIIEILQNLNGSILQKVELFMPRKVEDEVFETVHSKIDVSCLEKLHIMGASWTQNEHFLAFFQKFGESQKSVSIDLSFCSLIEDSLVVEIRNKFPNLTSLQTLHCPKLKKHDSEPSKMDLHQVQMLNKKKENW